MLNKIIKTVFAATIAFMALQGAAAGQLKGEFDKVGNVPAVKSLDKVVFEEFFNFTCPHCNNFRKASKSMLDKHAKRLKIVNTPIIFPKQADYPLRLYYVAEKLGKGEEIKALIFNATFEYSVNVYDPATVDFIARSAGIGEEYKAQGQSDWVNRKIEDSMVRAKKYGVQATPTVVLQESMLISPSTGMTEFVNNIDALISQVLK
ncbi:MAG: DsbA family protein [Deltaproteobacteria bacterium]|nr:DsbA family protein [Deltaproteobacteria bacterium]